LLNEKIKNLSKGKAKNEKSQGKIKGKNPRRRIRRRDASLRSA
jgi:hypothetical protein